MSMTAIDGGDGAPPEPDWSQVYTDPFDLAFAAEQWGAIIREMRDRTILAVANGHAIKRLVEFRVQYERAAKYLAEHGPVVKAKRTGVPQINPYWTIMRQADEVNTAKQLLSTALSVKRLYFGIPVGATDFWIAEEAWAAVQGEVDPEEMKGRPCWLSLDLSKKNDLTALTAVWVGEDGHLYAYTWYWTTKDGLADRSRADQTPYEQWVEAEHLTAVPGAVIDKSFVAAEVAQLVAEHDVQFLAFDPAGMADFMAACEDIALPVWRWKGAEEPQGEGLKLVAHGQGNKVAYEDRQLVMPRSIERLEDRILTKRITIAHSPVTYACAANAQMLPDGQGNRAFDKRRSRGRIDGIVTIAMGVGAATMNETPTFEPDAWIASYA